MGNEDEGLDYTRQDLRKATKFVEGDYSGINPRQFYRTLKRSIEEIQEDGDFKYTTTGNQGQYFTIQSEEVGKKTGTVKGRLLAESDWLDVGTGVLGYRPYGPHGAVGIVLGILFLLMGFAETGFFALALLSLGGGAYGYWQTDWEQFPIIRQDVVRVLINGEVSERTVDTETESRTDIFANMSLVYAGDAFVAVETNNLEDLNWNLRRELTNQTKRWYNRIVNHKNEQIEVKDGFVWHLKAWANRDVENDRRTIEAIQSRLLDGPFEYRLAYTDLLEEQLSPEMKKLLGDHEDDLMVELEELADDLDIYVEREGLQHTDNIQRRQNGEAPELDSGNP